jgi:tripartite-type tricarboxylate transporter receptor subunit TctC
MHQPFPGQLSPEPRRLAPAVAAFICCGTALARIAGAVGIALLATMVPGAFAQPGAPAPYPNKPITLLVPYTGGTTADSLARLLGAKLTERWGVATITDNRAGASGVIGTEAVAKAAPNGYTLLFAATAHGTVPALKPKLPFDPIKSFVPVSLLATSAMGIVVTPKVPATTVKEFIELAKSQPGKLDYSTPGAGGPQHLAMELFMQETGTELVHVPYKGSAGALTDIIGGHVQASVVSLQTSGNFIHSGQLRMLAVMSEERSPAFPTVPTLKELGLPNLVVDTWYGVMAPAGTPPEIVAKISSELDSILQLPDVREAMAKQGLVPVGGKPERMRDLLAREIPRWSKVVATAKIKTE